MKGIIPRDLGVKDITVFWPGYQNRKADYVGKFVQHIDWNPVKRRWQVVG